MNDKQVEKKILAAAKKIFTLKGKNGARMQEIADEAGVNKALLHYYFRSKEKLFQRVFEDTIIELVKSIYISSTTTQSFKEMLQIIIDKHIDFQKSSQNILQFFLWEVRGDQDLIREYAQSVRESLGFYPYEIFVPRIEEAINKGEIRSVDPYQFIMNAISLISFIFISLPLISSVSDLTEGQVNELIEKRKKEIFRLLWEDIKT